jgi:hypothetical protein
LDLPAHQVSLGWTLASQLCVVSGIRS